VGSTKPRKKCNASLTHKGWPWTGRGVWHLRASIGVEAQSGVFVARLCAVGLMLPSLWRVLLVSWLPVVVWYCTLFRGFSVENARGADPLLPVWFYNVSITLAYGNPRW